jgi:hypothetical protein
MAQSPHDLFDRVVAAAGPDGRLSPSQITRWDIFPFEQDGLRVTPLAPPVLPEPPRMGEDGRACRLCEVEPDAVWSNERWRLSVPDEPSGAPLVLNLSPRAHFDLSELPDELASELGLLCVKICAGIESLPHVARAHVTKWGDGAAHLHVFFYARPAGFSQLRGTCLAIWDDLLPPTPRSERDADAETVAARLTRSMSG